MFSCVVKLFGFPKAVAPLQEVHLELPDQATLVDVVAGLREKLPALEGFAIAPGVDRLRDDFKFNLNGQLIYTELDTRIHNGDRIALLIPVSGG